MMQYQGFEDENQIEDQLKQEFDEIPEPIPAEELDERERLLQQGI